MRSGLFTNITKIGKQYYLINAIPRNEHTIQPIYRAVEENYKSCINYIKTLKCREELLILQKEIDKRRRDLHLKTTRSD